MTTAAPMNGTTNLPPAPPRTLPPNVPVFTFEEMSEIAGLSRSLLRMWEHHYGWPVPPRAANGYRVFPRGLAEQVLRVAEQVHRGRSIGELIVDGEPRLPAVATTRDLRTSELLDLIADLSGALATEPGRYWTTEEAQRRAGLAQRAQAALRGRQ